MGDNVNFFNETYLTDICESQQNYFDSLELSGFLIYQIRIITSVSKTFGFFLFLI